MVRKKKSKYSGIWKRLHFKYRLSAINENTLEEIWKIRTSIFSGIVLVLTFAALLITITSVIIITTPIRYYLPGYLDSEVRDQAMKASIRIDSLEQQIEYQEGYTNNLKKVFAGSIDADSVKMVDSFSISENDPSLKKTDKEKDFVKKYEEEEGYNLSVFSATATNSNDGAFFFKPVKGIIKEKFNPAKQQYGVSITTTSKETILAALEGTIILAGYDINDKYVVQLQHKNGFISIYKHNTILLKKVGDRVRTGEAIAVIEDSNKDKTKDSYLYFELWNKGVSVNPEDYISFN